MRGQFKAAGVLLCGVFYNIIMFLDVFERLASLSADVCVFNWRVNLQHVNKESGEVRNSYKHRSD